jgi:hypothetical protein
VEARRWADGVLRHSLVRSARNLLLGLRTRIAANWNDYLRFGLRVPEASVQEYDGAERDTDSPPIPDELTPVFDYDLIHDFNERIPLALWVDASRNAVVPGHIQIRIAQSGWMRALLLGRDEEARQFMQRMVELQPGAAATGRAFLSAANADERHFAAIYIALRSPSLRPVLPAPDREIENLGRPHLVATFGDGYRMGCGLGRPDQPGKLAPKGLDFLTPPQRAAGAEEWQRLSQYSGWDASYLARETIDQARKHPDDPRVPEALHRAVAATHFGCTDEQSSKYSRQAFVLLHQRYPESQWTARTKYWY